MQCLLTQNRNKKVFGISNELLIGGVGTLKTQLADKKRKTREAISQKVFILRFLCKGFCSYSTYNSLV